MNRHITLLLLLIIPCVLVFCSVKYLGANDPALSATITCALAIIPTIITALLNNKRDPARVTPASYNSPSPTITQANPSAE